MSLGFKKVKSSTLDPLYGQDLLIFRVEGKGRHLGKSDLKKRFITYIQAGIRGADKLSGALRDSIIGGFDIIVIVNEVTPRTRTTDTEYCLL